MIRVEKSRLLSWSNNGYSTVPYSDVQDSVIEAWALI